MLPFHFGIEKRRNKRSLIIINKSQVKKVKLDKECQKKNIEVESAMIDQSLEELSKLILRLDNNPKKTRKDRNTIKKIQEIRNTIQDSVLYAKLKKSIQ